MQPRWTLFTQASGRPGRQESRGGCALSIGKLLRYRVPRLDHRDTSWMGLGRAKRGIPYRAAYAIGASSPARLADGLGLESAPGSFVRFDPCAPGGRSFPTGRPWVPRVLRWCGRLRRSRPKCYRAPHRRQDSKRLADASSLIPIPCCRRAYVSTRFGVTSRWTQ
jgi:hypothetical protein